MKKRWMALLICVLMLVMVIPGVANAQGNNAAPVVSARVAHYSNGQFAQLERMVSTTNRQIEIAVKFAQMTPWNDVSWLLNYVDGLVSQVFSYANSIGAVVVCEYTTYYIDGQYVLIDPLRVIPL